MHKTSAPPLLLDEQPTIEATYQPTAEIVIYPGDVNELLRELPSGLVQLIITSPPYNLGKKYETRGDFEQYLA